MGGETPSVRRWRNLKDLSMLLLQKKLSVQFATLRAGLMVLLLGTMGSGWAYTLTCDVQGKFPDMDKITLDPATVTIDISSIGNHLYIKMEGPKLYNMFANTIISPEFEGVDLTSDTSIWVKRKNIQTKEETEIKIMRQPVFVKAMKDVKRYGKDLKLLVSGPCQLPKN
jgi:hypothetical protein